MVQIVIHGLASIAGSHKVEVLAFSNYLKMHTPHSATWRGTVYQRSMMAVMNMTMNGPGQHSQFLRCLLQTLLFVVP